MMDKKSGGIALIGATGSVGRSVVSVCETFGERFVLHSMAARNNAEALVELQERTGCRVLALTGKRRSGEFEKRAAFGTRWLYGDDALVEIVLDREVDLVVVASSGVSAIKPVIEALGAGKRVCIANKESLIAAGKWISGSVKYENQLLPLDSEHNALWQCLGKKCDCDGVAKLVLTASGGPFLNRPADSLAHVTVEEVLKHPVWAMGSKITVDSASMMNKGFEMMEAGVLFGCEPERVSAVIHPESHVHGIVEFFDGTRRMAAFTPDMRIPILCAMAYPDILQWPESPEAPSVEEVSVMTFLEIDATRFPCFYIAREVFKKGGGYPAFLVGADEAAVNLFLQGKIAYREIPALIEKAIEEYSGHEPSCWQEAVEIVKEGGIRVREKTGERASDDEG